MFEIDCQYGTENSYKMTELSSQNSLDKSLWNRYISHIRDGMLEAAKNIWYPYLHRDIIATAQSCKECCQKVKNLKLISGKQHFTALDAVVEPNEEIQMVFAGPLPDENKKEVYILVGVDRFSRFPSAKVVTNTKADTIIRFMQTHC